MDADQSQGKLPLGPWAGIALMAVLWIGAIAVVVHWWAPAAPRYDMTAFVRGIPAATIADTAWLAETKRELVSRRTILQAAEALAGQQPSPTVAELTAFRVALEIAARQVAATGDGTLVLHYAGDLPQGPALVETLARRFAASQPPDGRLQVKLADASTAAGGFHAWAVGLLVVLAMCTGGWALAWWQRGDRPLASARQAQALLGVPVLAVDWRQ